MKKYLSVILALALTFSLAVPAFAAEIQPEGTAAQDVPAAYTAPKDTAGDTVYRIAIGWEATSETLSYTGKQSTYTWNTTGLVYDETVDTTAGWSGTVGYTVTVTNYSNAAVDASLSATNTYGLTMEEPAAAAKELGSAAVDGEGNAIVFTDTETIGNAKSEAFTYTYKANDSATAPTGAADATISVGKITVTVAGK